MEPASLTAAAIAKQVAIAAIAGMGGVGKTELALQYAIQHSYLS